LKEQDVDGRIILKCVLKRLDGEMGWIDLAQERQAAGCCECGIKRWVP
jgi:hypothetical protein